MEFKPNQEYYPEYYDLRHFFGDVYRKTETEEVAYRDISLPSTRRVFVVLNLTSRRRTRAAMGYEHSLPSYFTNVFIKLFKLRAWKVSMTVVSISFNSWKGTARQWKIAPEASRSPYTLSEMPCHQGLAKTPVVSCHHNITTLPPPHHHYITTSLYHHLTISPPHYITTSLYHHLTISPPLYHLTISLYHPPSPPPPASPPSPTPLLKAHYKNIPGAHPHLQPEFPGCPPPALPPAPPAPAHCTTPPARPPQRLLKHHLEITGAGLGKT